MVLAAQLHIDSENGQTALSALGYYKNLVFLPIHPLLTKLNRYRGTPYLPG